jgi:hypothetical protein
MMPDQRRVLLQFVGALHRTAAELKRAQRDVAALRREVIDLQRYRCEAERRQALGAALLARAGPRLRECLGLPPTDRITLH